MPRSKSSDTFKSRKEVGAIMTETDSFFNTFESKRILEDSEDALFWLFSRKIYFSSSIFRTHTNLQISED